MWVKHETKGVTDVPNNVGNAYIEVGVAVACDEHGNTSDHPKPLPKAKNTRKKK